MDASSSGRGSRRTLGLACALAAGGLVVVWLAWPGGNTEEHSGVPRSDAHGPASASALEDEPSAPPTDREPLLTGIEEAEVDAPAVSHRIRGRVLDEGRHGVAGAEVLLDGGSAGTWTTRTDDAGAYLLELRVTEDYEPEHRALLARDGHDRVACTTIWVGCATDEVQERELSPLVLARAHSLRVRVLENGLPRSAVPVAVSLGHGRVPARTLTTDEDGRVLVADLPAGVVHVGVRTEESAGRLRAFVPEEPEATLELQPLSHADVLVVDASTGRGIAGAEVELREHVRVPALLNEDLRTYAVLGESIHVLNDGAQRAVADADGRVHFEGLEVGARYQAEASAPEFHAPRPPRQPGASVEAGMDEVRVELEPYERAEARWPLVPGEAGMPADGTAISFRSRTLPRGNAFDLRPLPTAGRVEGRTLVAEGAIAGPLLAVAPDGTLASVYARTDGELGKPVVFRFPRALVVRALDEAGAPLEGAEVKVRNENTYLLADRVPTDDDGRVRIEGLLPELVTLTVIHRRADGAPIWTNRTIDLTDGDVELEVTLRPHRVVEVHATVRIDGVPRLPPRFGIARPEQALVIGEAPDSGELTLRVPVEDGAESVRISLRATGYTDDVAELRLADDTDRYHVEFDLEPTAVLVARVRRPREGYVAILPELFDEERRAWGRGAPLLFGNGLSRPNGPGDSFVFPGAGEGLWRVRDERSGVTSDPVRVAAGDARVELSLDLADLEDVRGRVELPADVDARELKSVRVLAAQDEPLPSETWRYGVEFLRAGAILNGDAFELRVPAGEDSRLVARHPWLTQAEETVVRGGGDGVVLRLVEGDGLRVPLPQLADGQPVEHSRGLGGLRVARWAAGDGGDTEPLAWHVGALDDGELRVALPRGTWDLLLEPGERFAPRSLRGVRVEGVTRLEAAEFDAGSTVRVTLLAPEGADSPHVYLRAERLAPPYTARSVQRTGAPELRLEGLGPGRYRLRFSVRGVQRDVPDREIEVDGTSTLDLDLDLR